jgi:hypothetical protein
MHASVCNTFNVQRHRISRRTLRACPVPVTMPTAVRVKPILPQHLIGSLQSVPDA